MKISINVRRLGLTMLVLGFVSCMLLQDRANAANTFPTTKTLVNINTSGGGSDNGTVPYRTTNSLGISADGNLVLFASNQTDIASSDGTGHRALYQRNISTGSNTRVDVSATGVNGNAAAVSGVMSESGRYVVFYSTATNLIDGTTTAGAMFYLKDMQTNAITLEPSGGTAIGVSNDARYVFFQTHDTGNLIPGARNGYYDLAMYDNVNASWTLVSAPSVTGLQSVNTFSTPGNVTSCDGSFLVFSSTATNLVSGYSGSGSHVFLADLRNGLRITDLTPGITAGAAGPVISCDGNYIAYGSADRTQITPTPSGMNSDYHVLEYNRITGARSYIDSNSSGVFEKGGTVRSVSNNGDALLTVPWNTGFAYYSVLYFKHIADGSGTRENVEGSLMYIINDGVGALVSANDKAVVYQSRDAYNMGLTPTDTCDLSTYNSQYPCDIVSSKTGQ